MNGATLRGVAYRHALVFALLLLLPAVSVGAQAPAIRAPAAYAPDVTFTLKTAIAEGRLVYIGVGDAIDGAVNPALRVQEDAVVQINLINGDGAIHDISFPDFNATSEKVTSVGASTTIAFRAEEEGTFVYFCTLPGHRQAGMEGSLIVGEEEVEERRVEAPSIVRDPTDLPPPIGNRQPETVRVDLESVELEGRLASGATYRYWTFNGKVPGPFIRVRVNDTVELRLANDKNSATIHSVDLHAVTGPGGGATVLQVAPGGRRSLVFKALTPGLYVYHCATPMVAHHITNGMYGLILVEPEGGLPRVDREFYVMQGELYTEAVFGSSGRQEFSIRKLLAEQPEYFVFNGAVGALTEAYPLRARVGETVRIYFGVGGPNFTSSFHVIGEIFDRYYELGGVMDEPVQGLQTVNVPAGGSAVVDFKLDVPGRYIIVDHALSRMERGLAGHMLVEGSASPEVYRAGGQQSDVAGSARQASPAPGGQH